MSEEIEKARRDGRSEERVAILEMLNNEHFIELPGHPMHARVVTKTLAIVKAAISERGKEDAGVG